MPQELLNATDVLDAHQFERTRDDIPAAGIVSIVVGPFDQAQAVFSNWLQAFQRRPVIPPSPDSKLIIRLVDAQERASGVLLSPEDQCLEAFISAAKTVTEMRPEIPIGIMVTPERAKCFLQSPDRDTLLDVHRVFLGGLVPLDPETDRALQPALERVESELYRSDHENILHMLMKQTQAIGDIFKVNYRYRILPFGQSFEIDFWCEALKFALEVDGRQHSAKAQRVRDEKRDKTLAKRGIKTLRIHASAVITDPTRTVATIAEAIKKRKQELS